MQYKIKMNEAASFIKNEYWGKKLKGIAETSEAKYFFTTISVNDKIFVYIFG
jgi:hypothetical protein